MNVFTTLVEMSRREHEVSLDRTVRSIDEFGEYCLVSSAVCVGLAINEYLISVAQGIPRANFAKYWV